MKDAPKAEEKEKSLVAHGHIRKDEYYWMKERDQPEVLAHLKAENEYTEKVLEPVSDLKERLYKELISRIKEDDSSVPYRYHGYWYYTRYEKGKEYPLYCRKESTLEAPEEILLDVNLLAEGQSYCDVGEIAISPDNRLLAYSVDFLGRRQYEIRFRILEDKHELPTRITGTSGDLEWDAEGKNLFYVAIEPETLRNHKVLRHSLETNESRLIFEEKDERFELEIGLSRSEKYLFIQSESKSSSEVRMVPRNDPNGIPRIFEKRQAGYIYSIDHLGEYFYILNNRDAVNFKLERCLESHDRPTAREMVIPHRPDVLLEDYELFTRYLVSEERSQGLLSLIVRHPDGLIDRQIEFDEPAYYATLHTNPEPDTDILRYYYSSLRTPATIVDYRMSDGNKEIKKVQEVPGYNPDDYISERVWVSSHDGTRVPVSLVRRKDTATDGQAPLLLYGYGSYGISIDATFNHARLSLLDRGWIYAIAHIRGGEEMGREWYEKQGKMLQKMNTFYDFIAAAEELIRRKYTSKDRLFAMGGSAGGLLIGAVINLRPDLFRGVVAAVPFVDVLTTMLDTSIPLTTQEFEEWGNPADKKFYDYILKYSPYDNVRDQEYPAVLVSTGYHDSQVQYWEPAKWVARLRAHQKGKNPILLHVNFEAGHGGASGRYEAYREIALYYAFMIGLFEGKIQG